MLNPGNHNVIKTCGNCNSYKECCLFVMVWSALKTVIIWHKEINSYRIVLICKYTCWGTVKIPWRTLTCKFDIASVCYWPIAKHSDLWVIGELEIPNWRKLFKLISFKEPFAMGRNTFTCSQPWIFYMKTVWCNWLSQKVLHFRLFVALILQIYEVSPSKTLTFNSQYCKCFDRLV